MTTGRNQPCPCGSGQKYKNCHEGKRAISKPMIALMATIALVLGIGVFSSFSSKVATPSAAGTANRANPNAGRPQPGPAPPGKVWSVEHGHWHDAAPGQQTQTAAIPGRPAAQTPPSAPVPQPPGTPPPGKVWSAEHGHWHDAPK